jgi:hypothetical protein
MPALAIAAAVLLLLGWWAVQPPAAPPPERPPTERPADDPLLAKLVRRDVQLARADTPRERLEILANLADDLHDESRALALAATGDGLEDLARLYEQVVRGGIVKQAEALPAAERRLLLRPIGRRLDGAAGATERLLRQVPPEYAPPLRAMVAAAREAYRRLRDLQEGRA